MRWPSKRRCRMPNCSVDEYSQIRTVLDKLFDACLEFRRPDHPDLEAEVTLYGDGLRLREFAMGHVWTVPAVQEESDYQRSVRVRSCIRPLLALGGFTCVAMQPLWPLALEGDLWGAERVGGDVWPLPSSSVASLAWKTILDLPRVDFSQAVLGAEGSGAPRRRRHQERRPGTV